MILEPILALNSHLPLSNLPQLHPLDILMRLHPTADLTVSGWEMSIITLISQLDGVRLCLNALLAEHALGTASIISDVIVKHYRACLWNQVHKILGTSELMEGSTAVANLGSVRSPVPPMPFRFCHFIFLFLF